MKMYWIIGIVAVVILLAIYITATYNSLVGMRNRVKDQWAQIDVQLKQRYDLTDDFIVSPNYDLFYTELVGMIQNLLDHGLQ